MFDDVGSSRAMKIRKWISRPSYGGGPKSYKSYDRSEQWHVKLHLRTPLLKQGYADYASELPTLLRRLHVLYRH